MIMKKKMICKKRVLSLLLTLVLTLGLSMEASAAGNDTSAISDAANGVARVFTVLSETYYTASTGSDGSISLEATTVDVGFMTGTAFAIGVTGEESDTFVTNRHVVTDDEYDVSEIWLLLDSRAVEYSYNINLYLDADGNETYYTTLDYTIDTSLAIRCDIEYLDDDSEYPDVAIIKTRQSETGRTALPLLSSDSLEASETVWAIGYPSDSDLTSEQETATGYKYNLAADISDATITTGIVSLKTEVASFDNTSVIQHTAAISSGNSGGPLLNDDGAVVGINTFTVTDDGTDYYAVTIDYIIDICEENGIDYSLWSETSGISAAAVAAIAAVVLIIVIAVAVILTKKKKNGTGAAAQPQPEPQPMPQVRPATQASPAPAPQQIAGDSGYRIQCEAGAFAGRRFAIVGQLRIGRDPNKNDLIYPADTQGISGVHCVVAVTDGQVTLMDLGSTYGTFLDQGQRLAANQPVTLQAGDRFCLGSPNEVFVIARKGGA